MILLHDSPRYTVKSFAGGSAYLVRDKLSGAERVYWGDDATAFKTHWEAPPCERARSYRDVANAELDDALASLWPMVEHSVG